MTCERTTPHLLALHFGELDVSTRDEVEVHLGTCSACTVRYFALKRAVELPETEVLPSARARTKLRAAIAHELGVGVVWWERALAFWVAAGAVACAIFLVR